MRDVPSVLGTQSRGFTATVSSWRINPAWLRTAHRRGSLLNPTSSPHGPKWRPSVSSLRHAASFRTRHPPSQDDPSWKMAVDGCSGDEEEIKSHPFHNADAIHHPQAGKALIVEPDTDADEGMHRSKLKDASFGTEHQNYNMRGRRRSLESRGGSTVSH